MPAHDMRRSRFLAVLVLALLGAPVAMHVLLHDLQEHHPAHVETAMESDVHGGHEHPIVGSAASAAPRPERSVLASLEYLPSLPAGALTGIDSRRSPLSLGAVRADDDVGLQALLSTFLI